MAFSAPSFTFSAGMACALRTSCTQANFTGSGMTVNPALYCNSISSKNKPNGLGSQETSPVSAK